MHFATKKSGRLCYTTIYTIMVVFCFTVMKMARWPSEGAVAPDGGRENENLQSSAKPYHLGRER